MSDPLNNPSANLLIKLGSAIVHAEEYQSPHGHPLDKISFDTLMRDPQVAEWMADMRRLALLPVKRND